MSEAYYPLAFGEASDALFRYIGIDEAYREAGSSFHTVETHINYVKEVGAGEPPEVTTQILGLDDKRLNLFHRMFNGTTGDLLCTTEQMLLHVDMESRRASPIRPEIMQALAAIMDAHKDMPAPQQQGRVMRMPGRRTRRRGSTTGFVCLSPRPAAALEWRLPGHSPKRPAASGI